jgi:hypothetical protein
MVALCGRWLGSIVPAFWKLVKGKALQAASFHL